MTDQNLGSLALLPKRPRVWGDDQTTTRMEKALAMAVGVDLAGPQVQSMRRHRRWAMAVYVTLVAGGGIVAALLLHAVMRWLA